MRVFLFTFFKMNLFFILSVLVPSHFEALLYTFSLTSHSSKFFQQSLRPCKVIRNPGSIIQLKESGIPVMTGVQNPSSTAKELIESGIQYLEYRIYGVESRMLGLALHDGRFTVWSDKINSEMFALSCIRVSLLLGTLRSNDARETRTSLKKWICL